MKKKNITKEKWLGDCYSVLDGKPILKLIEEFKDLVDKYGPTVEIDYGLEYDYGDRDGHGVLNVKYERLETDAELTIRENRSEASKKASKKRIATKKANQDAKDITEYKRLKKKFG